MSKVCRDCGGPLPSIFTTRCDTCRGKIVREKKALQARTRYARSVQPKAPLTACLRPGCEELVRQVSGRGRPRLYCDTHVPRKDRRVRVP